MPKPLKLRGWMLDAARLTETPDTYRRMIEECARWGFNAIMFRLTDDDGCSLRFKSRPELKTHPNALTTKEMKALVKHADAHGVTLIPEIESFGHTEYITSVSEHADLIDRDPAKSDATFNGLIPVHPRAHDILKDLYTEAASIFTGPYLHGGCDEVNWGGSQLSQNAIRASSRGEVVAGLLNRLNKLAKSLGKELIVWGDHVIGHSLEAGVIEKLDTDIILHDWNYWDQKPELVKARADKVLARGMRLVGGPAWGWCRWQSRPGREQLYNITAYADVYRQMDDPGAMGVLITNWCPGRYLAGAIWDGIAYGGVALAEGGAHAHENAFRRFVETHYAAAWSPAWECAFTLLYSTIPESRECSEACRGPHLIKAWGADEELRAVIESGATSTPAFTMLRGELLRCGQGVRQNEDDFTALCASVETLEHLYWRRNVIVEQAERMRVNPASARAVLETIAARDQRILAGLQADWDRCRWPGHEMRREYASSDKTGDSILPLMSRAAGYSAALAKAPEHFAVLLKSEKKRVKSRRKAVTPNH